MIILLKKYSLHIALVVVAILALVGINTPRLDGATESDYYLRKIVELEVRVKTLEANLNITNSNLKSTLSAITQIKIPTSVNVGKVSGKDIDRLTGEISILEKELTHMGEIYDYFLEDYDSQLEAMNKELMQLRKDLTIHTDNTTIHNYEGGE